MGDRQDTGAPTPTALEGSFETVARFEIFRRAFLDASGTSLGPLPGFVDDDAELARMYGAMVLTRTFDAKAIALQRTGRLGTYASSLGQEAVSAGIGCAMRPDDVLLPSFREHGTQLLRGVTMTELFLYWGGHERGCDFSAAREDFPVSIPVASHVPHAVGVALALRLRNEHRAAVCVFGDGATSKGDFYEALNVAGVWRLPVVFVAVNNQWAISVPRGTQTAAQTLAQKAIAAGIEGIQVDGNDIVAVRHVVDEALQRAREGRGPALVEALTYRLADHTTADDAGRYRDDAAVSEEWNGEPLRRLRAFMVERGAWTKQKEQQLIAECTARVEAAAEEYLAIEPEGPEAMFDHLHATLPVDLLSHRDEATGHGGEDG